MNIDKDMRVSDIILMDNRVVDVLDEFGMNCIHCNGAYNETLEWAAKINKVDMDKLLEALNKL